jgi:hypothetical protein
MKYFILPMLLAPCLGWGASQMIGCPNSLEIISTATPPAGWQVIFPPEPKTLERIGFYAGPPSQNASLVPDKVQDKKGESQDSWAFSPMKDEKIWVSCFYNTTSLSLAKPLIEGVRRCEVRYKATRTGARLSVIESHCD